MAIALFDKRKLEITRARFKAWWDGAEFDPATIAEEVAAQSESSPDDELFDAPETPAPARLQALSLLWGDNRILPGDETADRLAPAQLGLAPDGVVAVLGPGLVGPLVALAAAHEGQIAAFEWRDETSEALAQGLRRARLGDRVTSTRIDLETHSFEADKFDGVWSIDEFSYADEPTRFAHHLAKTLKTDRCVLVEFYAGLPSPDIAPAFASAFAEPHIRAAGDVAQFLIESGLKIEAQDDLTEEHLDCAKQAFKRLESRLKDAGGVDTAIARELAWETEAWRARLKLLAAKRLERRRIIARKPA